MLLKVLAILEMKLVRSTYRRNRLTNTRIESVFSNEVGGPDENPRKDPQVELSNVWM